METIREAKEHLTSVMVTGKACTCPVCNQNVKVYKRPLNSMMVLALTYIYKYFKNHADKSILHVERYLKTIKEAPASLRGDFPKLRHWDLIDSKPENGFWGITTKGILFIEGEAEVASHVLTYNKTILGYTKETVKINDVIRKKFDLTEILGAF